MDVKLFEESLGAEFYAGVPDSLLKSFCDFLADKYGFSEKNIVAANEGNAVGLAAGYYMATGKVPVVYLQNSGIGNIINPTASLLHQKVYGIPCIFVVGWRGEPGVHDEPQHIFQGEVTISLLEDMDMKVVIVDADTTPEKIQESIAEFEQEFNQGKSIAFVVKKGALTYSRKIAYTNENVLMREEIISHIVDIAGEDVIISTTGKASRELFEIRVKNGEGHERDFLTVGSMGHSSSIALSVALQKPQKKVWCIDGDGAVLMHMGAMAVIGTSAPNNLIHIVINNGSHETVGGIPTAAGSPAVDMTAIAKACGYQNNYVAKNEEELIKVLDEVKCKGELCFVEVKAAIGSRDDLGRPTTSARENIEAFMKALQI